MKYTPAPWKQIIAQPGTMLEIVNDNREYVCSLLGGEEHKEANARLIAAAPELLEVLEMIVDSDKWGNGSDARKSMMIRARAAIAKAVEDSPQ